MTHDDKELLLQDLSARLPYGVIIHVNGHDERVDEINPFEGIITCGFQSFSIDECKPYLHPMSSMTEEELYEVQEILGKGVEIHDVFITIVDSSIDTFSYLELQAVFDWLNKNHFDYRGLIEKGLAIEVNKNNNPYK